MLSINKIIVLAALAQVYGNEQAANQVADSEDSMNMFVNEFADKMIDRALTGLTMPQGGEFDDTVLGKPGQLSLPVANAKPVASMAMRSGPMAFSPQRLTVFQSPVFQAPGFQGRGDLQVVYANTRSAKKRIRTNERNRQRNIAEKSRFRTIGRKVLAMHKKEGVTPELEALAREWEGYIDKAAGKNIIHKNKAAHLKSQMAKLRNSTTPMQVPA